MTPRVGDVVRYAFPTASKRRCFLVVAVGALPKDRTRLRLREVDGGKEPQWDEFDEWAHYEAGRHKGAAKFELVMTAEEWVATQFMEVVE